MRRRFYVYECGDPYSRAADVTEETETGLIYRGDISGTRTRRDMESYLRRVYPGCRITRGHY
jgi:hypothetical protein